MLDFLANPAIVTLVIMFIWVPFAVGAYFVDVWKPKHPRRHAPQMRHAAATA